MKNSKLLLFICAVFAGHSAFAIRPFITDDARVVGDRLAQIESWFRIDSHSTQIWSLPAYGPTPWLELTAGGVLGSANGFSIAGPLVQAKFLLHPAESNRWPGVALATGAFLPFGSGTFKLQRTSPFAYLAITQNFNDEAILIHANVGVVQSPVQTVFTWGVGSQIRVVGGWNAVGEVVFGDPYAENPEAGAVQGGFRYILTERIQFDATVGTGAWGDSMLPTWVSGGVRRVF